MKSKTTFSKSFIIYLIIVCAFLVVSVTLLIKHKDEWLSASILFRSDFHSSEYSKAQIQDYYNSNSEQIDDIAETIWRAYRDDVGFGLYADPNMDRFNSYGFHYTYDFDRFLPLFDETQLRFFRSMLNELEPCYIVLIEPSYYANDETCAPAVALWYHCTDDRQRTFSYAYIRTIKDLPEADKEKALQQQARNITEEFSGEAMKIKDGHWWMVD
ncbi:MAG: hypothetical protein IK127_07715 [Clostridia bacterium]|nr:hypothetical protein [Clostridia bacterium]